MVQKGFQERRRRVVERRRFRQGSAHGKLRSLSYLGSFAFRNVANEGAERQRVPRRTGEIVSSMEIHGRCDEPP
jgi:hypothetical protein